jgi:hypothetical protein
MGVKNMPINEKNQEALENLDNSEHKTFTTNIKEADFLALKPIDFDNMNTMAFFDTLRNAKTAKEALLIYSRKFDDKLNRWAKDEGINYAYEIKAIFKNNDFWNCVAYEKINDFEAVRLFYTEKGFLKKRGLTTAEFSRLKELYSNSFKQTQLEKGKKK